MQSLSNVNITINLKKLKYNIQHSYKLCKEKSVNLAVVAKSICADSQIINAINNTEVTTIADSRLDNFAKMKTDKIKMLIRPAVPNETDNVIKYADASFQTELETIKKLGSSAENQNRQHKVLIMIDLGDLRDGILYTDEAAILEMAEYIHNHKYLQLAGIAANYNCFLGLLPDARNMGVLAHIRHMLEPYFDVDEPVVSGGTSSSISLLTGSDIDIPSEVNQFRIGEAVMLGRDPADNTFIDGYMTDVFTLNIPLLEVHSKPSDLSKPDELMRRGVLSIGKQDLQTEHLIPIDNRIKILGACSDECVIDLDNAPEYKAGDMVSFNLEYGALMSLFAGSFFNKIYI